MRITALALALALAGCRHPAGEGSSADAGAPRDAGAAVTDPRVSAHDAGPTLAPPALHAAPSASCPVSVGAARVRLAHRAAWNKAWSERPPDCKDACVVHQQQPPDADGNIYRYHLVIPARGGGFDVIEDVATGREPEKCGQFSAWETVVGGEPLHVHVTHLLAAGITFEQEVDDAGETQVLGWHCSHEGFRVGPHGRARRPRAP